MRNLLIIIIFFTICADAQTITTIAGGGTSLSDNIPATAAKIVTSGYGAFDKVGNFYFGQYPGKIREVSVAGYITTIAGTNTTGFSGDSGMATDAELNLVTGIALDTIGNLYFGDGNNNRVRKVNLISGIITTVVGIGDTGYSGDGGSATLARVWYPDGIVYDKIGNLYIGDGNNNRIRKVDTNGIISTIGGNGIAGFAGDNGIATNAEMGAIESIHLDNNNNLYIAEGNKVRKIDLSTDTITCVTGIDTFGYGGDGGIADSATLRLAFDVLPDNCGNFYISDMYNNNIRYVNNENIISTVVGIGDSSGFNGDGEPATSALLYRPRGIAINGSGNLFILDNNNYRIRMVTFYDSCGTTTHPTAIRTPPTAPSLSIFPNPATSQITITSNEVINNVVITNMMGVINYELLIMNYECIVDVGNWANGVYFVCINNKEWRKFVKE